MKLAQKQTEKNLNPIFNIGNVRVCFKSKKSKIRTLVSSHTTSVDLDERVRVPSITNKEIELNKVIENAFIRGLIQKKTFEGACKIAGISYSTFEQWMKKAGPTLNRNKYGHFMFSIKLLAYYQWNDNREQAIYILSKVMALVGRL